MALRENIVFLRRNIDFLSQEFNPCFVFILEEEMSAAWQLFAQCLSIASKSFGSFFKIWFTTLLTLFIIFLLLGFGSMFSMMGVFAAGGFEALTPEQQLALMSSMGGGTFLIFILIYALTIISVSGLSVNSYRFYLQDYTPTWIPFHFDWKTTFAFVGWSIVLGLIILLLMIVPMAIFFGLIYAGAYSGSNFMMFLGYLVYFVTIFFVSIVAMRLANKLVGRTIGETITFGEAWARTKGSFGFYFGLVLFSFIVGIVFMLFIIIVFGLFFALFQNSPTMMSITFFVAFIVYFLFYIFLFALQFAIGAKVYQRFFGATKADAAVFE